MHLLAHSLHIPEMLYLPSEICCCEYERCLQKGKAMSCYLIYYVNCMQPFCPPTSLHETYFFCRVECFTFV